MLRYKYKYISATRQYLLRLLEMALPVQADPWLSGAKLERACMKRLGDPNVDLQFLVPLSAGHTRRRKRSHGLVLRISLPFWDLNPNHFPILGFLWD